MIGLKQGSGGGGAKVFIDGEQGDIKEVWLTSESVFEKVFTFSGHEGGFGANLVGYQGSLYGVGSYDGETDFYKIDVATGNVTNMGNLPFNCSTGSACIYKDKLMATESGATYGVTAPKVYQYDFQSGNWTLHSQLPSDTVAYYESMCVFKNELYLSCDNKSSNWRVGGIYKYNESEQVWEQFNLYSFYSAPIGSTSEYLYWLKSNGENQYAYRFNHVYRHNGEAWTNLGVYSPFRCSTGDYICEDYGAVQMYEIQGKTYMCGPELYQFNDNFTFTQLTNLNKDKSSPMVQCGDDIYIVDSTYSSSSGPTYAQKTLYSLEQVVN